MPTHINPYDSHTLDSCLEQAEILSGTRAKEVFVDLGYRGALVPNVTVYKARQKRGVNTRRLKRALKRHNSIEPIIGHLKNDGLLGRNYLKGELGDAMHAILCAAGHNIRLILRAVEDFLALALGNVTAFPGNQSNLQSVVISLTKTAFLRFAFSGITS